MTQLLDLNEPARATEDGQGKDGDLSAGENPEHLIRKINVVLLSKTERLVFACKQLSNFLNVLKTKLFDTNLHDEEDDQNDDSSHQTKESQEESLAGTLAVHTPVSPPLLGIQGGVRVLLEPLSLDHLDLVLAHVLPHDVGDGGRDQAEMQFQLDPEKSEKKEGGGEAEKKPGSGDENTYGRDSQK